MFNTNLVFQQSEERSPIFLWILKFLSRQACDSGLPLFNQKTSKNRIARQGRSTDRHLFYYTFDILQKYTRFQLEFFKAEINTPEELNVLSSAPNHQRKQYCNFHGLRGKGKERWGSQAKTLRWHSQNKNQHLTEGLRWSSSPVLSRLLRCVSSSSSSRYGGRQKSCFTQL